MFGWLQHPSATRQQLHQTLLQTGQQVSAQGFEARFTPQATEFLRAMVEAATQEVFRAELLNPLLRHFQGVYLTDCTRIEADIFPLKVAARLELQHGSLQLSLEALQTHDNASAVAQAPLPQGALHIGDLGFFDLKRFAYWQQTGVEWVTRYKTGTALFTHTGERLDLEQALASATRMLSLPVWVGHIQRLPMRLVAQRLDETGYQQRLQRLRQRARRKQHRLSPRQTGLARWTIYLTSLTDLSFVQIHTLYRARWQMERLFKRWKSLGHLATSTTRDPHRRACEVYAKLLAVLVAHWLTQLHGWATPSLSHDKFFSILQQHASLFALLCFRFPAALDLWHDCLRQLQPAAFLSRRKHRPNAAALWAHFDVLA